MSSEFQKFLVDPNAAEPKQFTEAPPPPPPIIVGKTPSGYTPMSQIELEGQAYGGMTSGRVPWWVLITGAVMFVVPILGMAIASGDFIVLLIVLLLLALPMMIVWRGVCAKLAAQKEKEQRRNRRKING